MNEKMILTKELCDKVIQGNTRTLSLVEKRGNVLTVKNFRGTVFSGVIAENSAILFAEK